MAATGWFRRKISQFIDLKSIRTSDRPFRSYTRFRALALAVIITVIGIVTTVMMLAASITPAGPAGQGAL